MPCRSGFLALGTKLGLDWIEDKGNWKSGEDGAETQETEMPRRALDCATLT